MTTGSILFGVALLVAVAVYLARPFLVIDSSRRAYISERHQLETEKEALLLQIQQLDFDHDTGKIPTPIHERQRAVLVEEAAEVIKNLDALKTQGRPASRRAAEIEAVIARIRGDVPPAETAVPTPASTPAAKNGVAQAFCTQCGSAIQAADKFCATCGHKLQTPLAADQAS